MWILPFCCHGSPVFLALSLHHLYGWMPPVWMSPVWIHSNTETAFPWSCWSAEEVLAGEQKLVGTGQKLGRVPEKEKFGQSGNGSVNFSFSPSRPPSPRTSLGILLLHLLHLPPLACTLPSQQPQELAHGRSRCSCCKSVTASSGKDAARRPRPVPERLLRLLPSASVFPGKIRNVSEFPMIG